MFAWQSPPCSTSPRATAGRSSFRCRTTTTSSNARRAGDESVLPAPSASACCPGAAWRAGPRRQRKPGEGGSATVGRRDLASGDDEIAQKFYYRDDDFAVVEAVTRLAREKGVSNAALAYAWLLHQPGVSSPSSASASGATRAGTGGARGHVDGEDLARLASPYRPHRYRSRLNWSGRTNRPARRARLAPDAEPLRPHQISSVYRSVLEARVLASRQLLVAPVNEDRPVPKQWVSDALS